MAAISAALVKELREKSGAGMMDCKKALQESDGDLEAAADWLRKKGLAAAAKKAGRVAAEGLVGAVSEGNKGALVEVNAETDFVARNESFQDFVRGSAALAQESSGDLEAFLQSEYPGSGNSVAEQLTQMIATIGENMSVRRLERIAVSQGVVASYIHNKAAPGLGKMGVLVGLESAADPEKLAVIGSQVAMHIAASQPQAINRDGVDASALDKEREILSDQARASGKPEEIIGKMVEGRLRKYYEEVCLLEQAYVINGGETSVGKALEQAGKDLGAEVKVAAFARFKLGEGVEKQESDFAAEVAATLGS
ncbi:MAG: translation elongation factor Ts [Pseudomonadota bacterium]